MSQSFLKPNERFSKNVKVELNLSNCATKADLEEVNHASLKTDVNKIDINKQKAVPANLSKLSNEGDNDVIKKSAHDELVTKVNNFIKVSSTSILVSKTQYDSQKQNLEKKIKDFDQKTPNIIGLVKACVRYFSSKFYFFHQMIALLKL